MTSCACGGALVSSVNHRRGLCDRCILRRGIEGHRWSEDPDANRQHLAAFLAASPEDLDDAPGDDVCRFCRRELPATAIRRHARFCSKHCRQAAWRLRRRRATEAADATPKRCAYADPPYPGRARRYYDSPEVDHDALIARLETFDGWALSTSADALAALLPKCPPGVRVCAWVKPIGASPQTYGLHNCWEPLLVKPARRLRPGVRDWLAAQPARRGGELPGRKPIAFCAWLFDSLGMLAGDSFDDLFPGTGIVSNAWACLSRERGGTP